MPYRAGLTKERVLLAARLVLERRGALELRALARHLGVQAPSLYRYVPSLAALRAALVQEGYKQLGASLIGAIQRENTVRSFARGWLTFARANPHLYLLMHAPDSLLRRNSDEARVVLQPIATLLGIPVTDRRFMGNMRALRAYLHGFTSLELTGQFIWGDRPEEALERGLSFFALGYRRGLHRRSLAHASFPVIPPRTD